MWYIKMLSPLKAAGLVLFSVDTKEPKSHSSEMLFAAHGLCKYKSAEAYRLTGKKMTFPPSFRRRRREGGVEQRSDDRVS